MTVGRRAGSFQGTDLDKKTRKSLFWSLEGQTVNEALIRPRKISIRALCNNIHCTIFLSLYVPLSAAQYNSPGFASINMDREDV